LLLESLIFQTEAEIRWLDYVEAAVIRESQNTLAPSRTTATHASTQEGRRTR
jgi:hypothetical protein